VKRKR